MEGDDESVDQQADDFLRFQDDEPVVHRRFCERCEQPLAVCLCNSLPETPIVLKNHVYVLQHPHEPRRKNRSLPIVRLILDPNSLTIKQYRRLPEHEFRTDNGVYWLLVPGEDSISLSAAMAEKPIEQTVTLLFLDATWRFAREMDQFNIAERRYPKRLVRVQLTDDDLDTHQHGRFAIRPPPKPGLLSTAECLAYCVATLEGRPDIYNIIVKALDTMVENWKTMKNSK